MRADAGARSANEGSESTSVASDHALPACRCPIVVDGRVCGAPVPTKHWACRSCWLRFPAPFRCNANRYRRGTREFDAMIVRANVLLSGEFSDLEPPWRR